VRVCVCACVCVCLCVCARAYLDVAHLHCLPILFEINKVRGEGSTQGFTERSVLQEHGGLSSRKLYNAFMPISN
jgi:hypothetical protein